MSFWTALSALAPVAPAMAEAQDIRRQKAIQDQALQQESERNAATLQEQYQRIRAGNQPIVLPGSKPEWNPLTHKYTQPAMDPNTGKISQVEYAGADPLETANRGTEETIKSLEKMGVTVTPAMKTAIAASNFGFKSPTNAAFRNLPGAAGQPYEDKATGKLVRNVIDPETNEIVTQPMPEGYKLPEPKPGAPRPGQSGGKNVFGFFNPGKKQWQDAAGNALPDFKPLPSFAETGLYEPVGAYEPSTQSFKMGSFNRRTGQISITGQDGGAVPMPAPIMGVIGKDFSAAREAQTRLRIMEQNEKDALEGKQQAMLSLVANHIGMTLGAQKGARINQAVWNEAVESAPFLGRVAAQFGPDGYLVGVKLTPDQIKQMVELAKERNDLQWQQVSDTGATYGVDLSGAISQSRSGAPAPKPSVAPKTSQGAPKTAADYLKAHGITTGAPASTGGR